MRPLLDWLGRTLRAIRPQVESLVLERAFEAEILYLETLISGLSLTDTGPDMSAIAEDFAQQVAVQFGFLPSDPRRQTILEYTTRILQDDLSAYWQGLVEPKTLARRVVKLRDEGLSYVDMSRKIADQYQTSFYRAERLIRSSYNSSANFAHYQELLESGTETHSWLDADDARVRRPRKGGQGADHRAMRGQTVKVGEPFVTPRGYRLLFPGDRSLGAPPDEVINCRCVTV